MSLFPQCKHYYYYFDKVILYIYSKLWRNRFKRNCKMEGTVIWTNKQQSIIVIRILGLVQQDHEFAFAFSRVIGRRVKRYMNKPHNFHIYGILGQFLTSTCSLIDSTFKNKKSVWTPVFLSILPAIAGLVSVNPPSRQKITHNSI